MIRTAAFALIVLASAAAAQTPRLAIRASFVPNAGAVAPDTAAMQRSALGDGRAVYLGETLQALGVGSLTDARVMADDGTGSSAILLVMAPDAARAFSRLTETHVAKPIAIVLDGRVLTSPVIGGPIANGRVQIDGGFARAEAEAIVAAIREAAQIVPIPVDLSTPEAAVLSIRRAAAAGEWLAVARILHPSVLLMLRDSFDESFVMAGDSVRASAERMVMPGPDGTPSQPDVLPWIHIRDVIGTGAPGPTLEDFSDEQAVALALAGLYHPRLDYPDAPPVTLFVDAAGMAFVVLYPGLTQYGEDGFAEAVVLQARRVGDGWRVLLPKGLW